MTFHTSSFVRLTALATLTTLTMPAVAASAVVNGNANPNLAGRDAGYTCCSGDVAPDQSPTLVSGLTLVSGQPLTFVARGEVSNTPFVGSGNNPDGTYSFNTPFSYDDGIAAPSNVNRLNALMGVFLGAASPTGGPTPERLDFSGGLNFTTVSPQIGQMFFIGNGLTGDTSASDFGGTVQSFIVPTAATRLFLGTSDGVGWYNNSGQFSVEITAVPEPETYAMLMAGLGLLGAVARRRKISQ